jgi:signal transduction histidine kinase
MSTIMVLDDRKGDRELLTTILGYAGHEVIEAQTGMEALVAAREHRPQVIITDLLMPSMNGYEFVRRLRSEPAIADTKVIFSTATYVEGEVRHLAESCGVSHFLPKPSEPRAVIEVVGQALGSPDAPQEATVGDRDFDREQLRVLNDKLVQKAEELESLSAQRQQLVVQLLRAHEEERKRIAHAIHDDPIQAAAAISIRLDTLAKQIDEARYQEALESLRSDVASTIDRLRNLVFELEPVGLHSEGLVSALTRYLRKCEADGIEFELDVRTDRDPDETTRMLLYRSAQEALANVRKHADASQVRVELSENGGGWQIAVRDNGVGFDPAEGMKVREGHLGLPSMRERLQLAGGSLEVRSRPGEGATVEIRVPEVPRESAGTDRSRRE